MAVAYEDDVLVLTIDSEDERIINACAGDVESDDGEAKTNTDTSRTDIGASRSDTGASEINSGTHKTISFYSDTSNDTFTDTDDDDDDDNIVVTIDAAALTAASPTAGRADECGAIAKAMLDTGSVYQSAYAVVRSCKNKNKIITQAHFDQLQMDISRAYVTNARSQQPPPLIALPTYVNNVGFADLRWLHLPNRLHEPDLVRRIHAAACTWTYNDEDEVAACAKRAWIDDMNDQHLNTTIVEPQFDHFVCLVVSHLRAKVRSGGGVECKGVVGLAAAYVRNVGGRIWVLDVANIKLSCNARNGAYGRFDAILNKRNCRAVLVYCQEGGEIEDFLTSNLYPWSSLLANVSHKTYNLVEKFKFKAVPDKKKDLCLDARRHAPCCALCNLNVFLLNVGSMEHHAAVRYGCEHRVVRPLARHAVDQREVRSVHLCKCNGVTYMEYGSLGNAKRVRCRRRRRGGRGSSEYDCAVKVTVSTCECCREADAVESGHN